MDIASVERHGAQRAAIRALLVAGAFFAFCALLFLYAGSLSAAHAEDSGPAIRYVDASTSNGQGSDTADTSKISYVSDEVSHTNDHDGGGKAIGGDGGNGGLIGVGVGVCAVLANCEDVGSDNAAGGDGGDAKISGKGKAIGGDGGNGGPIGIGIGLCLVLADCEDVGSGNAAGGDGGDATVISEKAEEEKKEEKKEEKAEEKEEEEAPPLAVTGQSTALILGLALLTLMLGGAFLGAARRASQRSSEITG